MQVPNCAAPWGTTPQIRASGGALHSSNNHPKLREDAFLIHSLYNPTF